MKKDITIYTPLMLLYASIGMCTIASSCLSAQPEGPLIPLSVFFDNPDMAQVTISPDGEYIAYLAPESGVLNVWIQNLATSEKQCITHEHRSIGRYFWGYDNKTIFYYKDIQGDENHNLNSVTVETGATRNLTPFPASQVRLIKYSSYHPTKMLVGINYERADLHDVYQLNTETGELTMVEKNPGYVAGFDMDPAWYADNDLMIRIALSFNDDGGTEVLYREHKEASWEHLLTWDVNASAASYIIGFNATNDELYIVDASDNNTAALVSIHLATKERKILAADETFDIVTGSLGMFYDWYPTFLMNPTTGAPAALFVARDVPKVMFLDQSLHDDMSDLQKCNRGFMYVVSSDMSFQKWIVTAVKSDRPDEYYLYDRGEKSLQLIGKNNIRMLEYTSASMEPVAFTARDGLKIHGYLTYPITTPERSNLPLVVLVHGGPWMRDVWRFDARVQFFANRGYACLQINYRGSSGYGTSFVKASDKECGRAMQHDLIDGAEWLIKQGIVDHQRVAICGGSFGGYAALAGATFTPHFYKCAISVYGPANLIYTMNSIPPYWKAGLVVWKYRKGDPIVDELLLREQSPIFHINNICIPMLIAHGAHDARVKQSESDSVVEALRQRNIPCEYILFGQEGHGFSNVQSRYTFWGAVEKFLAQHLGGRCL